MATKKYVSLSKLATFLENLSSKFAALSHKHNLSDLTDYTVDTSLSSTSTNPVQNKVIDAEFDAIADAMGALETAIDGKSNSNHAHAASDISFTTPNSGGGDAEIDRGTVEDALVSIEELLDEKANASHTHTIANVTNLQSTLDAKVPTSRTINGKALTANITLSASDVGAAASSHTHDDIYYTESEIDTKLATKADKSHTHDDNDIRVNSPLETISGNNLETVLESIDSNITTINSGLSAKVPTSRTINNKPLTSNITLTASDVGADANGAANAALDSAKSYTDTKVSGLASTSTVDTKISTHNTSTSAHNDIRVLISDLSTAVNNFLDVDDTTTDQLSEVLTLINNNKGTLESLTTSKINVSDIVNNLTTNSTSKVLSAAQGVTIKELIDALQEELDSHTHAISDVSGLQSALDGKAASSHTHEGSEINISDKSPFVKLTAGEDLEEVLAQVDSFIDDIYSALNGKVPTSRTINGKALTANITLSASDVGAAASSHTHDDIYYTESEIDTKLATKADKSHTHVIADVANLQTTIDTVNETLAQKTQVQIITWEADD